jgi:hypothetical protein
MLAKQCTAEIRTGYLKVPYGRQARYPYSYIMIVIAQKRQVQLDGLVKKYKYCTIASKLNSLYFARSFSIFFSRESHLEKRTLGQRSSFRHKQTVRARVL